MFLRGNTSVSLAMKDKFGNIEDIFLYSCVLMMATLKM